MKYYKSKVIDNMPDDDDNDDDIVNRNMQSDIKFTIRINDDDPMQSDEEEEEEERIDYDENDHMCDSDHDGGDVYSCVDVDDDHM